MSEKKKEPFPKPGGKYEVPVDGSLGLLAIGYRGLLAWREAIRLHKEANKNKGTDEKK